MRVQCPECRSTIELRQDDAKSAIDCPKCEGKFTIAGDETLDFTPQDLPRSTDNRLIGEFELIQHLGAGAFGNVWLARDRRLDRIVALKIPRHEQLDPAAVEKFMREARAAAQLRHPNIVRVHEVGEHGGLPFIAIDYIDGVDLEEWLKGRNPSPRDAAEFVAIVADALHHAHEAGVVHRDLKPSNIMVDAKDLPHVMDFGLAKRDVGEATVTMDGQILGTPAYMSPEQAQGDSHNADRRSDVYSLGVILYELLTGELPFRGNIRMILQQVIHDDPPQPRKLNNSIPIDLETVCLRCLEKDAARRFRTAGELRDELERFLRSEPVVSRRIARPERIWRWCRRNPVVAGLSTALMISLLVGLVGTTYLWLESAASVKREAKSAGDAKRSESAANQEKNKAEAAAQQARTYLDLSQRDVFALQLARAASVGQETPAIGLQLLDGCNEKLHDFAWKHLRYALDLERFVFPDTWTAQVISADGKQIALGNEEGAVVIWEVASLKEVRRIRGPQAQVFAIDPSFQSFVVADEKKLSICDMATGKVLKEFNVGLQPPNTVTYAPDGMKLAVFEYNMKVPSRSYLVDLRTYETRTLGGAEDPLFGGRFSRNGSLLAVRSKSGVVSIRGSDTLEALWETKTSPFFPRYVGLHFSGDDSLLAYVDDEEIKVLDISNKQTQSFSARLTRFNTCALSVDKSQVIGASQMGPIQTWDRTSGTEIRRLHPDANSGQLQAREKAPVDVEMSPSGDYMLTRGTDSKVVRVWHTNTLGAHRSPRAESVEHWDLACSPAGDSLIVASPAYASSNDWKLLARPSSLRQMSVAQLRQTADFEALPAAVASLTFSSDGKSLAVGCGDGSIALWDFDERKWLQRWVAHDAPVTGLLLCNDDQSIVSAVGSPFDPDHVEEVKVWHTATGELSGVSGAPKGAVFDVATSRDGKRIAYGDSTGSVYVLDSAEGKLLQSLSGHSGYIWSVAFDPIRNRLAVGAGNYLAQKKGEVVIWDLDETQQVATLHGHAGAIFDIKYSPDGRTLASASYDKSIRLWDPVTGEERATLDGHQRWVRAIEFLPDGSALLSASGDGTVIRWDTHDRLLQNK